MEPWRLELATETYPINMRVMTTDISSGINFTELLNLLLNSETNSMASAEPFTILQKIPWADVNEVFQAYSHITQRSLPWGVNIGAAAGDSRTKATPALHHCYDANIAR